MKKLSLGVSLFFISCLFSAWAGTAGVEFHSDVFSAPKINTFTSEEIHFQHPMNQAVVSWNVLTPENSYVVVSLRAKIAQDKWTPWLPMGTWGTGIPSASAKPVSSPYPYAKVEQDTFVAVGSYTFTTWQYQLKLIASTAGKMPQVYAVNLAARNTQPKGYQKNSSETPSVVSPIKLTKSLSQFEGGRAIGLASNANRICSPTSLSMLIAYELQDSKADVLFKTCVLGVQDYAGAIPFGNWSFNMAYAFHVLKSQNPGSPWKTYARWYESFNEVLSHVSHGHPVAVNIKYGAGELTGAAMPKPTAGHLVVVRGADEDSVFVSDPAAEFSNDVAREYRRDEFIKAWKGLAYVVEKQP